MLWRRVPESNRSTRICNPLRNLSANPPEQGWDILLPGLVQAGAGAKNGGVSGVAPRGEIWHHRPVVAE